MSESEIVIFYLQLAILAIGARIAGEVAGRFRLPVVAGEILAGVFLGPTLLRHLMPSVHSSLFPLSGNNHIALNAITTLGVTLFLLAAGLEVDLRLMRSQAKLALPISLAGIAVPFIAGFVPAILLPQVMGINPSAHHVVFAIFVGAALAITALPITAKILIDLDLYKTPFGMLVMSSALSDDFLGWTLIGIVFAVDNLHDMGIHSAEKMTFMVGATLAFALIMMTVGRWLLIRLMDLLYKVCLNSSRVIGFIVALGLLGASFTQAIGIHGLFGAFIVGAAIGSANLKSETKESIQNFVSNFLAPVFFASVGMATDFMANFSFVTTAIILIAACLGKILGCFFAARLNGLQKAESLAIGIAMNGRGSMEVILGLIALQEHIITEQLFVALAVMAIITSCVSGRCLEKLSPYLKESKLAKTAV